MQRERRAPRWPRRSVAVGIVGAMLAGGLLFFFTGRGLAAGLGTGAVTGLVMALGLMTNDYVERRRQGRSR